MSLTDEEKRRFILREAVQTCNANMYHLKMRTVPLFIIQKRCGYVAGLTEEIQKDCADLCLLASHAETYEQFHEACGKSREVWQNTVGKKKRQPRPGVA